MGYWLVTGGSSGIGLHLVRALQARGNEVLVWDVHAPPEGTGAAFDRVDMTRPEEIAAAASRIACEVDSFVHCAGAFAMTSIHHDLAAASEFAFRIHSLAFVAAVQSLLGRFLPGRGNAVAISSAATDMAYPGTLAYGPSKAALERAVLQLAVELGGSGIRVNSVCPGAIATDLTRYLWADPGFAGERLRHIPLGRQAEPGVVSEAVMFLCSDAASYITGETLRVDGGVRHGMFQTRVREAMAAGARA